MIKTAEPFLSPCGLRARGALVAVPCPFNALRFSASREAAGEAQGEGNGRSPWQDLQRSQPDRGGC